MRQMIITMAAALALSPAAAHAKLPRDPLGSPVWDALGATFFGDDPVRFDNRVKVVFPAIAENQRSFPVTIDARAIGNVKRIILFADLNPIPLAIDYRPNAAQAFLGARIKLDQRTPVRGAVQLADGSWLVGGGWIDAAGGGCSAPPLGRVRGDWADHLGEVRGIARHQADGTRVRLAFRHPMDTGLVANTPSYYLETLTLTGANARNFGEIALQASVAEDPAISIVTDAATGETLMIAGTDTSGIAYRATLVVTESQPTALVAR